MTVLGCLAEGRTQKDEKRIQLLDNFKEDGSYEEMNRLTEDRQRRNVAILDHVADCGAIRVYCGSGVVSNGYYLHSTRVFGYYRYLQSTCVIGYYLHSTCVTEPQYLHVTGPWHRQ